MKNILRTTAITLALSFSIYCFCYINTQDFTGSEPLTNVELKIEDLEETDQKNETYFPDLAVVEKIANLFTKILKVI